MLISDAPCASRAIPLFWCNSCRLIVNVPARSNLTAQHSLQAALCNPCCTPRLLFNHRVLLGKTYILCCLPQSIRTVHFMAITLSFGTCATCIGRLNTTCFVGLTLISIVFVVPRSRLVLVVKYHPIVSSPDTNEPTCIELAIQLVAFSLIEPSFLTSKSNLGNLSILNEQTGWCKVKNQDTHRD